MKLLVLTRSKNDYAQRRFREEVKKRKIEVGVFNYSHLCFKLQSNNFKISSFTGENLSDYDIAVLRSPGLERRYLWQERILVNFLVKKKKRVLNKESFLHFQGDFDKFLQSWIFYQNNLPILETRNYGSTKVFEASLKFPFAFKRIFGSLGRDFTLIKNSVNLKSFLENKHPYEFLHQPFLTTREDYRIIVLGGKALGAIKRIAAKGKVVTNVAAGGTAKKAKLTKELVDLALKASKALFCEFAGVDVMYDKKGNPYLLEVNRYPVFKGFERVTGANVAGEVIDYLLGKKK